MDLYIGLDGRQLTFRTNVDEVREFVANTFHHMLEQVVKESAGNLGFFSTAKGYTLESEATLEYSDTPLEELIPLVKDEVRLQLMRDRPDLLWMHAGAIERHGGALLLSGTSGQGKSTLSTSLCARGWRFLSDDIAPVRMDSDRVIPFPQSPVRRLHPGREVTREELGTLERETVDLADASICREETEIRGMVFIEYVPDAEAALMELDRGAGALEMLRNATNFFDHKGAAVARAASLATRIRMLKLSYGLPQAAGKILDGLW